VYKSTKYFERGCNSNHLFHSQSTSKKRFLLVERENSKAKNQLLEDVYENYKEESFSSRSTSDLVSVKEAGVNCIPKMQSVRTQYQQKHFMSREEVPVKVIKTPLLIKMRHSRKFKEIAINTELSFKPSENVSMTVEVFDVSGDTGEDSDDSKSIENILRTKGTQMIVSINANYSTNIHGVHNQTK